VIERGRWRVAMRSKRAGGTFTWRCGFVVNACRRKREGLPECSGWAKGIHVAGVWPEFAMSLTLSGLHLDGLPCREESGRPGIGQLA
jgi:hypothetical protein